MNLRFKSRIAIFNTAAGAVVTLLVFIAIYIVVHSTAYKHLDSEITSEKEEVFSHISWVGDSLVLDLLSEQLEAEHRQAEVSPTFLQVVDSKGLLLFRTSNLMNDHLRYADALRNPAFFDIELNGRLIRQGQFPIINQHSKILGQVGIGIPQVESTLILKNLRLTLIIAFPIMLLVIFFASSLAASQGISPINDLIKATGTISDLNLSSRVPLPVHHDEVFKLASTINELLSRLGVALEREKRITADISHELRTPVTGIRGTLEVLIRKTREPAQYENKIRQVIDEVDSLNRIIDQLLQLSRLEAGNQKMIKTPVMLHSLLQTVKDRWQHRLNANTSGLTIDVPKDIIVNADKGFLEIIFENLISNALKYGNPCQTIICRWDPESRSISVADQGPGIPGDHIPYLFNRFYRTDSSRSSKIQGSGLGLAIVKVLAEIQGIKVSVNSKPGEGTSFTLKFIS